MSTNAKLVRMINQISRNFEALGQQEAIEKTAEHIIKFWDPRMRAGLTTYLQEGGTNLTDLAEAAFKLTLNQTSPRP